MVFPESLLDTTFSHPLSSSLSLSQAQLIFFRGYNLSILGGLCYSQTSCSIPFSMKLYKHYNQEILQLILMLIISFLMVMISVTFVRYLALAAGGAVSLKDSVAVLGILLPSFINILLPITLFLGIVIGINKLLHENELLIGFACGMSFKRLLMKIFRFALPISLIGFILSFAVIPKMNEYQDHLQQIESQNSSLLDFVPSGRFFSLGSKQIIYVNNVNFQTHASKDIFIYQDKGSSTQIVLAPSGTVSAPDNSIAEAKLSNGQEYEFSDMPDSAAVRITHFTGLTMMMVPEYDSANSDLSAESSSVLLKAHTTVGDAELEWRASLPLASFVLAVLGTVLSDLRPRQGKLLKIFYAITIFIIYFNLLSVFKSLVAVGHIAVFPGLFIVHFVFLALGLALLALREGWFNFIYRIG